MKNPLMDMAFLRKLDLMKNKTTYAKIILLTFNEEPVYEIQGKITAGSVNIDGASAVRRTCSLTMVSPEVDITNTHWALKNKFKLEVGVENFVDSQYPDIIWFKQGTFVFTSLNMNVQSNNFTITLSGKDKMCLLNGEVGGSINASTDFGKKEEYKYTYKEVTISASDYKPNTYYYQTATNTYKKDTSSSYTTGRKYYEVDEIVREFIFNPIQDIIRNAVHTYAGEPYHNIILNDIDDYGLELLEYRGDIPLYMPRNVETGEVETMTIDGDTKKFYTKKILDNKYKISLNDESIEYFDRTNSTSIPPTELYLYRDNDNSWTAYNIIKIIYGDTAGYRKTDLTYPGDLIANVGESLMSVLDKIKNMFSDFEYFYDVDGRFVFQKKKTYINESWNNLQVSKDEIYADAAAYTSSATYSFEEGVLLTAFSDVPNIMNVKNDFSIWGTKKTATGTEVPIHLRYAIDFKPDYYKTFDNKIYLTSEIDYENMYEDKAEQIVEAFYTRLKNFELKYTNQLPEILLREDVKIYPPQKREDGSWTPGWWDIRDWYEYYITFKQEVPNKTMKWYSKNSKEGCQRLADVIPKHNSARGSTDSHIWLIIVNPGEDPGEEGERITSRQINIQHGSGDPTKAGSNRTCYESYLDENGKLITVKCDPLVTQYFIPPYSGCADTHTYLEFLINDVEKNGNLVYFYNPDFPGVESYAEALREQVNNELKDWEKLGEYNLVDWREIIYQMSLDYFKHGQEEDFYLRLAENNLNNEGLSYYPNGITGYECYYTDLQGFWRQLYNPEAIDSDDDIDEYWTELDITAGVSTGLFSSKTGFNENVTKFPETLNFWFDFMNTKGEMGKYAIATIGNRPKAINDNTVKAIYYKDTPSALFLSQNDYEELLENLKDYSDMTGYTFIKLIPSMENYFTISSQGKSARDVLDNLLYQHTYATETVNLTAVPIYHLQPNTRVFVKDDNTGINGEYLISKITIPLQYNGTSSISTTKAVERIY